MSSRPADTRTALLRSAINAFARRGYAGTSIVDILQATGLSKPTLYYYFDSKAGLFRAILAFAFDESFRLMQSAVAQANTTAQKLIDLAAALFEFTELHRDLTRLVFSTAFAAPDEIPASSIDPGRRRRNFEFILALVRAGQESGELDPQSDSMELTHGIFGAISQQIRTHLLETQVPLDVALARRVVALYLNGARSHPSSRPPSP